MKLGTLNNIFRFFGFRLVVQVDMEGQTPTLLYFVTSREWKRRVTNTRKST